MDQPQQPQQSQQPQETGSGQLDWMARAWDAADESRTDKGLATMNRILQRRQVAQQQGQGQQEPQQQEQPPQ